jgi:methylsterol monooxygenase
VPSNELIITCAARQRPQQYQAYKARVAAAKPSQREAIEKEELAEVEKEGLKAERLAELGGGKGGMEGVPKGKLE